MGQHEHAVHLVLHLKFALKISQFPTIMTLEKTLVPLCVKMTVNCYVLKDLEM
jgi:hypothetical protein